jgi:hypothetical protein
LDTKLTQTCSPPLPCQKCEDPVKCACSRSLASCQASRGASLPFSRIISVSVSDCHLRPPWRLSAISHSIALFFQNPKRQGEKERSIPSSSSEISIAQHALLANNEAPCILSPQAQLSCARSIIDLGVNVWINISVYD